MESNHDIKMLQNSNKPYYLKQRILSDRGHLSNEMCSKYLKQYVGKDTKKIILIHLSHENNTEEKVLNTLKENLNFDNVIISKQDENTELIEI